MSISLFFYDFKSMKHLKPPALRAKVVGAVAVFYRVFSGS